MTLTSEEARALQHRLDLIAQGQFREANLRVTLGGNWDARNRVWKAWRPVLDPTNYIEGVDPDPGMVQP